MRDTDQHILARHRKVTLLARYNGVCRGCAGVIRVGQEVTWSKGVGVAHPRCWGLWANTLTEALTKAKGDMGRAACLLGMSKEGLGRRLAEERRKKGGIPTRPDRKPCPTKT
jgi:hypothetical protein